MKGVLTTVQEKWLRRFVDNLIKLNRTLELVDGLVIGTIIGWFDNHLIENKLSDETKEKVINIINLGIARDLTGLAEYCNKVIDIPKVEEDAEAVIFGTGVPYFAALVYSYVDKQQAITDNSDDESQYE